MITVDFVEGIIQFADAHRNVDRQDISNAVFNIQDRGLNVTDLDADELVAVLEVELADEL